MNLFEEWIFANHLIQLVGQDILLYEESCHTNSPHYYCYYFFYHETYCDFLSEILNTFERKVSE